MGNDQQEVKISYVIHVAFREYSSWFIFKGKFKIVNIDPEKDTWKKQSYGSTTKGRVKVKGYKQVTKKSIGTYE